MEAKSGARLKAGVLARRTGLVVAIDEEDPERAVALAAAVRESVDAVKVGYPTVLACGVEIIGKLKAASKRPVICDFKIADIPPIAAKIARRAFAEGASGVIAHAFAGSDSLRAVVKEAHSAGAFAIAVIEMSHDGGKEFTAPAADVLLQAALAAGADGVVAPATRPDRIARLKRQNPDLLVFAPGAGAQGGPPRDAARAGADFVIVGRSITQSQDPAAAAKAAAKEIAEGRVR